MSERWPEGVPRPSVRRRVTIALAAQEAGHEPTVEHVGKRFRLTCPCGFATPLGWTRKHAFQAMSDHMVLAGRTALGETPKAGTVPPVKHHDANGVSLPPDVGPGL